MRLLQACDLCGGTRLLPWYSRRVGRAEPWSSFLDPQSFPFSIRVLLCRDCGWLFKSPGFDQAELARLYSPAGGESHRDDLVRAVRLGWRRGEGVLESLASHLPAAPLEVLDVGGRSGELMGPFVERGYDVTVVDPSPGEPVYPTITKVRKPFLALDGRLFGLVIMSHVLEHTDQPTELLNHAWSLLEPDGLLFVDVPFELATPLLRRHVGDHRHLGYFSTRTLHGYLLKCGFRVRACQLIEDSVGAPIPVIRAVARRSRAARHDQWRPGRFMMARSVAQVADPRGLYPRLRNRLRVLHQRARTTSPDGPHS